MVIEVFGEYLDVTIHQQKECWRVVTNLRTLQMLIDAHDIAEVVCFDQVPCRITRLDFSGLEDAFLVQDTYVLEMQVQAMPSEA